MRLTVACEDALEHYLGVLFGPDDTIHYLDVEVDLGDTGPNLAEMHPAYYEDELPLEFYVTLSERASPVDRLVSLAHEAVHVWQYATGLLSDVSGVDVWNGVAYPPTFPYEKKPWEVQAMRLEVPLLRSACLRYGWSRVEIPVMGKQEPTLH